MTGRRSHGRLSALNGVVHQGSVTPPLDAHPILAEILADRARSLSRDPSQESLVIVAHGPNGAADADRWMSVIRQLGVQIRSLVPFQELDVRLLRDDAPKPVKDQALAELRHSVASRAASGRVVVVPLLLGPGRVLDQVPDVLTGLEYLWDGRPVLPDSRIADWVLSQADSVTGTSTRAAGTVTGHVVDSSGDRLPQRSRGAAGHGQPAIDCAAGGWSTGRRPRHRAVDR